VFFSGNKNRLLCQKIPLNLPGDNCKLSPLFHHNKQGQMNVTPLKYLESERLHPRLKNGNHLGNFEKNKNLPKESYTPWKFSRGT